jgi:hypothetical protein
MANWKRRLQTGLRASHNHTLRSRGRFRYIVILLIVASLGTLIEFFRSEHPLVRVALLALFVGGCALVTMFVRTYRR